MSHLPARRTIRTRAFTLVELLTVVAIISLLVSILLPALSAARDQGRSIVCLARMRECGRTMMVFAHDHGDRIQLSTDLIGLNEHFNSTMENVEFDRNGELMSWTAALAKVSGYDYKLNRDWGVLANNLGEALSKQGDIKDSVEMMLCPSDKIRLGTPFYPRNKAPENNGLYGPYGENSPIDTSYWGRMSYGLNEDIAGAEVEESNGKPACWRAALTAQDWYGCKGEFNYPPVHPCGDPNWGTRLQGSLDKVHDPAGVGLMFEAGPDSTDGTHEFANLILSAKTDGPYLGDFQMRFGMRMPIKRHRNQRLNIHFADMHGETVEPQRFEFSPYTGKKVPSVYNPRVRVSPYPVHDVIND